MWRAGGLLTSGTVSVREPTAHLRRLFPVLAGVERRLCQQQGVLCGRWRSECQWHVEAARQGRRGFSLLSVPSEGTSSWSLE